LLLNSAFSFADFFAYLKTLLTKGTFGLSDFDHPQTVQYFVLEALWRSLSSFLIILAVFLCSLGIFLLVLSIKRELNKNYSRLSHFLRMDKSKILKQAQFAALPKQVLFWSFFAPVILISLFSAEAKLGIPGLGNNIKTAFERLDFPVIYGSFICIFLFVLAVNIFFLTLRFILLRK